MWILEHSKNMLYWNNEMLKILSQLGGYDNLFIPINATKSYNSNNKFFLRVLKESRVSRTQAQV